MKKEEIFCAQTSCHSSSGKKLFDYQTRLPAPLIHQTIEEENEALRSKNHILEEKLKFYEREFHLKVISSFINSNKPSKSDWQI